MGDIFHKEVDTSGLECPMPILRLKQGLKAVEAGQVVKLIATDAGSQSDVPAFCAQTGHHLLRSEAEAGRYLFWVEKRA